MIMRRTILSIILFMSIGSIFAQPGYLGNKFSINLSGDFFLSVRSKDNQSFGDYYIPGIKSTGGINLSYIISNSKALELGYSTFKDWNADYSLEYRTFANLKYIKQNSFGLSLKSFFRNSTAPLGSYVKLTAAYTNNFFSDNINFTTSEKYPGFKLGVGFGRQRIIIDKIVIDYGVLGYINLIGNDEGFFNRISDMISMDSDESTRIFLRDQIYIHLSIGYLIF